MQVMKFFVSFPSNFIDKFLWALTKTKTLNEHILSLFVQSFEENFADYSNKYFIQTLLLLSKSMQKNQAKKINAIIEENMLNRFMKMSISELTDLLWWMLAQENRNKILFNGLQKELQNRVMAFRDEELLQFLQ